MYVLTLSLFLMELYIWTSNAISAPTWAAMLQNTLTWNLKKFSGSKKVCDCQYETTTHHVQLNTLANQLVNQNWILLNSESTIHIFNNAALLTNIQHHLEGNTLKVFLNGGSQVLHMMEHFGGIDVWYNPDSLANILWLAQIIDQFQVTMDLERACIPGIDRRESNSMVSMTWERSFLL